MLFLTILLLVIIFVVYNLVLIVHVREVCVIERLGKFRAVLDAGLHFLIPFVVGLPTGMRHGSNV